MQVLPQQQRTSFEKENAISQRFQIIKQVFISH